MNSFFTAMAFVAVSLAQVNGNYDERDGITEEERDIIWLEEIVKNMDTEEQVDFMIDYLQVEKEAAARQEQFDSITPEQLSNYAKAHEDDDNFVVAWKESEVAEEWDENEAQNYFSDDDYNAEPDLEDTMTEEEWLKFYDENLAQSEAGDEMIQDLEEMKE